MFLLYTFNIIVTGLVALSRWWNLLHGKYARWQSRRRVLPDAFWHLLTSMPPLPTFQDLLRFKKERRVNSNVAIGVIHGVASG
jgi:hypothetical protein